MRQKNFCSKKSAPRRLDNGSFIDAMLVQVKVLQPLKQTDCGRLTNVIITFDVPTLNDMKYCRQFVLVAALYQRDQVACKVSKGNVKRQVLVAAPFFEELVPRWDEGRAHVNEHWHHV